MMKITRVMMVAFFIVKAAVVVAEHPRTLFEAFHEQSESREATETTSAHVAFFGAIRTSMRAFIWMVPQVVRPMARSLRPVAETARQAVRTVAAIVCMDRHLESLFYKEIKG